MKLWKLALVMTVAALLPMRVSAQDAAGANLAQLRAEIATLKAELAALKAEVKVIESTPGFRGPRGPQGVAGEPGRTGPPGPQGPVGNRGAFGPRGIQGPIGERGLTGPSGGQGNQGVPGPEGPPSADGRDGAQGPQGPSGPQGAQGPLGPPGPGADVASLAGISCPGGSSVTGFDEQGHLICSNGQGREVVKGALPESELLSAAYNSLVGTEFPLSFYESGIVSGLDLTLSGELLGFAFCLPDDPNAPPAPNPTTGDSMYGCVQDVKTKIYLLSDRVSVEIKMDQFYTDFVGSWSGYSDGDGEAYVVFSDVTVNLSAPLLETGFGTMQIGEIDPESVIFNSGAIYGDVAVLSDSSGVFSLFTSVVRDYFADVVRQEANDFFRLTTDAITETFPEISTP